MLLATAFYGVGSTLSRILLGSMQQSPTSLSAVQMAISTVLLAPLALIYAPAPAASTWSPPSQALWGLIALGVLGTSFAYVLFYRVVRVAGATTAASVTYVVPVIATALGILVLNEEMAWYEPVGAVVVLVGVWLAQRRPKPVARPQTSP